MLKESNIVKLLILLLLLLSTALNAASQKVSYEPFIVQQMEFVSQMHDANITQKAMSSIVKKQTQGQLDALENIISNKEAFLKAKDLYTSEIYTLEKIININKRAGNTYAVLRDEVQINSYKILSNQNRMMKEILEALEYASSSDFGRILNDIVIKNQLLNQDIMSKDYKKYLDLEIESKTFNQAKKNIEDFYNILEVNIDIVNHIYSFESRMYRLNEYAEYKIIGIVLFVNKLEFVKMINPILELYGLNVIKIMLILIVFSIIYFIRKVLYVSLHKYILSVDSLQKYSKSILQKTHKPFGILIVLINIELTIYIYHDFQTIELLAQIFNIAYAVIFIWHIYRVLNVVASIKIHDISTKEKNIKNEMINVGMKIINFIIMLIGLLIILKLAGVNLTTVLSGLGIGGFAVALAAKDSLSNFFGTLSILLSDVFSQGDWIAVDGNEGVVVEMGLRVTTLRTFDNALIAIPNATLANKEVKNWNKRILGRRIKMSLGVKYDSKSQDIKNAIDEIRIMLDKHSGIATQNTKYSHYGSQSAKLVSKDDLEGVKKTLLVYLDEFSDSSINILVYCFSKSVDWQEWLEIKEDIMHKIMDIFEKNSLEFAFPSMSIYHENEKS